MTQTPEQRLEALDHSLPRISKPAGNLLGFKIDHGQIFVSGQLPLEDGTVRYFGKVGDAVTKDEAYEAAELAALNAVSQLSLATEGDLSRIAEIIKLSGFVNCAADFTDIPAVVNGASDLFVAVFGDRGSHARFAIGVASLPRGVPVEIEVIARLRDEV
ncbi:RidA family protein [Agrobacterium vitis]|uniref:RidA family protein n=1 Tax=Agrobacterium vitis TaxID=373 RepID=UPI001573C510|nr:RidA family protein [Agrobacterium vitis]NSZ48773.1 RidA family protein [Agrobacterium vitis]UJL73896.1 RidA family protein [Agrobacterium vitis]